MPAKKHRAIPLLMLSRQATHRLSLALMLAACLTLLVLGKTENPGLERVRTQMTDVLAPAIQIVASPLQAIEKTKNWAFGLVQIYSENSRLHNQNIMLMQWQERAKEMMAENDALRALMKVVTPQKYNYVTVRMVSDVNGPYLHSALMIGGSEQGVAKNRAVINEQGLVGRVIEAGKNSSRILLLSDINSRVPVIAERTREKSILAGNDAGLPSLSYVPVNSKLSVGERILTSGDGGVFPAGVPVGMVVRIEKGIAEVQPFVNPAQVEYVSVIDHAM